MYCGNSSYILYSPVHCSFTVFVFFLVSCLMLCSFFSFLSASFTCILLTESGASSLPWMDHLWTGKAVWWCYHLFWGSQNRTTLPIYLIYKLLETSRTRILRGTRGMSRRQRLSAARTSKRKESLPS